VLPHPTLPGPDELPRKNQLLPDLSVTTQQGVQQTLAAQRGRRTCVVVAVGRRAQEFNDAFAPLAEEFATNDVTVILILPSGVQVSGIGLIVVRGEDSVHGRLGARGSDGEPMWAAYVTDQYGEIYALWRERDGDAVPSALEVLDWAKYVNVRCEECFPPEWPAG